MSLSNCYLDNKQEFVLHIFESLNKYFSRWLRQPLKYYFADFFFAKGLGVGGTFWEMLIENHLTKRKLCV